MKQLFAFSEPFNNRFISENHIGKCTKSNNNRFKVVCCKHNYGNTVLLLYIRKKIKAVSVRQINIKKHQRKAALFKQFLCGTQIFRSDSFCFVILRARHKPAESVLSSSAISILFMLHRPSIHQF